jgi:hypothetical protein
MMKKLKLSVAAVAIGVSALLASSCIGPFAMSRKVLDWNQRVTNVKFVNWLVFLVFWVVPVYEISMFIDAFILNSIEFWTGNNPVANIDTTIKGSKGTYHVKSNENGYDVILLETGEKAQFLFDRESKTWSYAQDGKVLPLVQFDDEGIAHAIFSAKMPQTYAFAK